MTALDDAWRAEQLRAQAEVLRSGEAFGRSHALDRLFRFLLACSLEGRSPKELEIADEVFGRNPATGDQDASIRVHIHRLRRKLDEYYTGPGAREPVRLVIPKGGYRLIAEPVAVAVAESEPETPLAPPPPPAAPPAPLPPSRHRMDLRVVTLLLVLAVTAGVWLVHRGGKVDRALASVQASPIWRSAASNVRPVIIVVGDYYLFGERDADGQITRLVREFDVNSPQDLAQVTAGGGEQTHDYVDLGLNYLPVGVGNALRRVIPVVSANNSESLTTLRVVPASRLRPDMLKQNDIVYLGFLSGLGSLRDPMFSGSRFAVGTSYDEILDRHTGRHYLAGTHLERGDERLSSDYALISRFTGVAGNQVMIIAGTRDAALMQAAEYATKAATVAELTRASNGGTAFDALLGVESFDGEGLRARLLVAAPRPTDADWSGRRPQAFPDDLGSTAPTPPAAALPARGTIPPR